MENVAEKFIEALKERKLSEAIDHIKAHLTEQRQELEESQRIAVAVDYGFTPLQEEKDEEDKDDDDKKDDDDDKESDKDSDDDDKKDDDDE